MANPRRNSFAPNSHQISISIDSSSSPFQTQTVTVLSSVKKFLKKPHAFPFLLSIFLLLTWVSLRLQHSVSFSSRQQQQKWRSSTGTATSGDHEDDQRANLVRFPSIGIPSPIAKDKRGWLLDPLSIAADAGIPGGALTCASVHIGEIRPGGLRGNHRHHTCNETFLIWGANTVFRLENNNVEKGYAEVIIGADEVAVAASPNGRAHALVNIDPVRTTFFLGCQDRIISYNSSTSDFNVWKDL